jgi:uncharacterized protein (TIGR00290 family)
LLIFFRIRPRGSIGEHIREIIVWQVVVEWPIATMMVRDQMELGACRSRKNGDCMIKSKPEQGPRYFCSWSGGKDSCLSLYRAIKAGYACASLFTMIDESGRRSRSHGLPPEALKAQSEAMGIPLRTASATWENYESQFKKQAALFRNENILHGVFGDIDLEPHREWVERICRESGITAHLPLWKSVRRTMVHEFIEAGFKALIVVVNTKKMPGEFLGRCVDETLVRDLEAIGVDACGENGEFHTFVCDGPLFKRPLCFTKGDIVANEEYVFLPITVPDISDAGGCS